jgi:YD repeat-containing protein
MTGFELPAKRLLAASLACCAIGLVEGAGVALAESPPATLPTYSFAFGSPGRGSGQFEVPTYDAIDPNGNVWVSDTRNNRIEQFSSRGAFIRAVGSKGKGEGQFREPLGIAVNPTTGGVYVVDAEDCRVEEFSGEGQFVRAFGKCGKGNGEFFGPDDIAVNAAGDVYVTDAANWDVQEFTSTGQFIRTIGSEGSGQGQFVFPRGITINPVGDLYVVDSGNNRVEEFTETGLFLRQFGSKGTGEGEFEEPFGIALSPSGNVFVVDPLNERVEVFTQTGSYLGKFGSLGAGEGQFEVPWGVAIAASGGVYVVDHFNDRVSVWQLPSELTGQPGWAILEDEADSEFARTSVNIASGNLLVKSEDLPEEAETKNLRLDRLYNSQAIATTGTLGPGWSLDAGPDVYLVDEGTTVILHGPSGYVVALARGTGGTYTAPAEFEGTLTKNENGTYTLTNENNLTYQFNTAGEMTSDSNEAGETFTVGDTTIAGTRALHTLSPSVGKALEATYNAVPELTQTSDPASHLRHYEYNATKRLATYIDATGAKTEYAYDANNYLNKITMPDGTVEKITTVSGKVSEVLLTPPGGEATGEKFSYHAPTSPCNASTDAGETIVTSVPGGETETYCWDSLGHFTGPKSETETEEEGTGTPAEVAAGTCEEDPELHKEDCALEEGPPENPEDLKAINYGLSDNNWLQPRSVGHASFDYLAESSITALGAMKFRRVIPWNMVSEAEHDEEKPGENPGALALLEDVEEWIKLVKERGGEPYVSFEDLCPSNGIWDDPRKLSAEEEEKDDHPCSQAPSKAQYKAAVEKFLKPSPKHERLGGVTHFTAMNEPNNQATVSGEHVKPTWSNTGEAYPGGPNGAYLAGQYWRALSDLCAKTVREAEKRPECYVAAGDFLDAAMPDAYNPNSSVKSGYPYFQQYIKGLGSQPKAYRWAWHAYSDGVRTQTRAYKSRAKHWWGLYHNFEEAVDHFMKHARYPHPDIWLSEQGVVYIENGVAKEVAKKKIWGHKALAENILNAYVKHGASQLTNASRNHQITRFFYYSSRGAPTFDSGLLEAAELPAGLKPERKYPTSHPREIYRIYKQKTPG